MINVDEKRKWLGHEVEEWKNEGIIDSFQARKILDRYETEQKSSRLITVVSVLGALLVGVGAILFIASNWKAIPDALKLIMLFGTTYATYFAGWKLKYETGTNPKLGNAFLFLGSIFVGVTIFLVAQIFNVNANAHWLILMWFIAILPFGYAFDSKYILGLNIFTFVLWTLLYVSSTRGFYFSTFETFMLFLLFGISLYGLGQLHSRIEKYSHFRLIYQCTGLFLILISYYYFSMETPYRHIFGEITTSDNVVRLLFMIFGTISLVSVIISSKEKYKTVKQEFYVLLLAFAGWVLIWSLAFFRDELTVKTEYGYTYTQMDPGAAAILFILFNLMLFTLSIGSILIGYHKNIVPFVNLGMLFFVLGILHLYFTTLYELLPRSLAFITGGLILLGAGWYLENKRRSLIKEMEAHIE